MKLKFEKLNKKTDIFLGIFLGIIVIIAIFAALNPAFGQFFTIENFFQQAAIEDVPIWVAMGFTMLVCFLGALIPFPVPYAIPISIFAAVWLETYDAFTAWSLILILVLLATIANTVGDLIDYLIGEGAQKYLSDEEHDLQNNIYSKIILSKPKAIPYVILLFGLTPLPDSLLMVPLGIVKYDLKKTMLYMFIGRFFMMLAFAFAGILAIDALLVEGSSDDGTGWILGVVLLFLLWVMIVLMVKVKPEEENNSKTEIVE